MRKIGLYTVFEKSQKKSHSTFRANRGQTVLPERSILIGQKLMENAKIEKNQVRHF